MKPAREWANDRQLAYDVSDLESEKFYSEIQRDAQAELRSEIERLRKAFRVLRSLAVTRMSQDGPGEYTQGREHEAEFWSDMLDAVTLKEEK